MTISYPRPLYSNPAIDTGNYKPNVFDISAISQGETTTVTTSADHDMQIGQLVRFVIPAGFGIRQLNGRSGYIISVPASNQIEVNVTTNNFDAFISGSGTPAQIKAIGNINQGYESSTGTTVSSVGIPGAFTNIS